MKLTLELDPLTAEWLTREAKAASCDVPEFVTEILRELADPDAVEGDLIDRLLAEAKHSFPPIMELDEQAEMREEVLDDLCRRLVTAHREMLRVDMALAEQAVFRTRLQERAGVIWG
jgi:hypothetical protein